MRIPLRCLLINDKRKEVPPVPLWFVFAISLSE